MTPEQLAHRPLDEPAETRLPLNTSRRAEILAAHAEALEQDALGYSDPESGLFVLTARYLADRGYCCGQGCRHCPYVEDEADLGARPDDN